MKKIKKIFLGIGALWSTMIAKVYANSIGNVLEKADEFLVKYDDVAPALYGPPPMAPIEKAKIPLITIIAIVLGINFILPKVFKDKKKLLNIVLIISSVVVTVSAIILVILLIKDKYNM